MAEETYRSGERAMSFRNYGRTRNAFTSSLREGIARERIGFKPKYEHDIRKPQGKQ